MAHGFTRRETLALAAVSALGLTFYSEEALATTALAITLSDLANESDGIFFGRPGRAQSRWETVGSGRRIVTYTPVQVQEPVHGELEAEYLVRTLGGKVGDTGQIVHGEATLRSGQDNLVFVRRNRDGIHVITARAQGHYPLRQDERGTRRLHRSPSVARLVRPENGAVRTLVGRSVGEARRLVLDALQQSK